MDISDQINVAMADKAGFVEPKGKTSKTNIKNNSLSTTKCRPQRPECFSPLLRDATHFLNTQ